jgi:hypothetical protein
MNIYDSAIFDGRGKIIHLYYFPHSWFILLSVCNLQILLTLLVSSNSS